MAGSLALTIANVQTLALLSGSVSAPAADATLQGDLDHDVGGEGDRGHDRLGRRRSVALNLVTDMTQAASRTARSLSAHDLTLQATSTDTMTTTSQTGAAGGGIAIAPSVAVSLSTVTTDASLGTGAATTLGGALTVAATQTASVTTTASGSASASDGGGRRGGRGDRRDARRLGDDEALAERDRRGVVHRDGLDVDERLGDRVGEGDVELGAVGRRRRPGRG